MPDFLVLPPASRPADEAASTVKVETPVSHRRIESLVILLFWLLILEGSLRKWVLPQFSQYLFFIRDPVLLLIYWQAQRAAVLRGAGPLLQAGIVFAALALPLALVQISTLGNSQLVLLVVYGWRQYFLYLPLPFVIAVTFSQQSLLRFARHAAVAIIITAPLMFAQFNASGSSVVNRGIADEENLQFQSFSYVGGRIRPSGTFTSTVGVTELVSCTFALLLAVWLMPPAERQMRPALLLGAGAATAVSLALCGSRAAFVHCGLVVMCAMLLGAVSRSRVMRSRAFIAPLAVVAVAALLYPIVFPEAFDAFSSRVSAASIVESQASSLGIVGRAFDDALGFVDYMARAPLFGYGLGLGGNGRTMLTTGDAYLLAQIGAESDWSRHIVDLGPVLGVFFIIYRIIFTGWLFSQALQATRASASPLPLLLFGYVGIGLFYGQLTGHGTVGGFLWIGIGLCMASCARPRDAENAQADVSVPRWKFVT